MALIDVKIPGVGESITEVTLARWSKKDGEAVRDGEILCEIESDKATLEIPSPSAGVLKIIGKEGETYKIGFVVGSVDSTGVATVTSPAASPTVSAPAKVEASAVKNIPGPAAAKILAEKNISADTVIGSGKDGRITKGDALDAKITSAPKLESAVTLSGERVVKREKMSRLRKTIANRLVEAKNTTAMLTTFNEVDMQPVMQLRSKYKDSFKEKHGVGLGFMSFFTKACCVALKDFPSVGGLIDGDDMITYNYADIGVAVSTPKGLVVPVIRSAESMSLAQIEKAILNAATKARDGKLSIEEMTGGNFTITNGGVFGSMLSTPIINIPQSAILGMHNIVERPVAINGQVVIRPIMYVALSYDHRIIDGRESVSFLKKVKELIEDPARLLLDV
jgi:2-oxoglutarate dehydrogenase E2 component (dihydrolipoamide succinyltransferase)